MLKTLRVTATAIAVAAAALFSAAPTALSVTYGLCSSITTYYANYHDYEFRPYTGEDGVVADTRPRNIHTCTDRVGGPYGATFVPVVNMQDAGPFVQLGYGRFGQDSEPLAWMFTPNDNAGGAMEKLTDYCVCTPLPLTIGDPYRFSIGYLSSWGQWEYSIRNLLTDAQTTWDVYIVNGGTTGSKEWYGFETYDAYSEIGGNLTDGTSSISNMGFSSGYVSQSGTSWNYLTSTGTTSSCTLRWTSAGSGHNANDVYPGSCGFASWYVPSHHIDSAGREVVSSYTSDHG